ncbi:hypothetical protein V3468_01195 [Flavobacterium oreochromis]|uniref:hypothetical protein n=1 Tax=Flavobacterium oreochromis TaxID=2906078 RepID=UPI00385A1EDC
MTKKIFKLLIVIIIFSCKDKEVSNENNKTQRTTNSVKVNDSNKTEDIEDMTNQKIKSIQFSDLFNEGIIINFSPKDLENPSNEEEIQFKEKLIKFEKENSKKENFKNDNLLNLINNETFENCEYYINSDWLNYFIEKYSISNKLKEVMIAAINQEDYNAVKIILKTGYIISIDEVKLSDEILSNTLINIEINKNRKGLDENGEPIFYRDSKSKSKQINELLNKKYNYYIFDKDGHCNLRDDEFLNSYIKGQIRRTYRYF